MSKALERPLDPKVERAYADGYNKNNRVFSLGGVQVKVPTSAKEADIKLLCASLMPGGDKVELKPELKKLRSEILKALKKGKEESEGLKVEQGK